MLTHVELAEKIGVSFRGEGQECAEDGFRLNGLLLIQSCSLHSTLMNLPSVGKLQRAENERGKSSNIFK